jgi:hypothetical protein
LPTTCGIDIERRAHVGVAVLRKMKPRSD